MCWDDGVSERKPYASDLSDERWALIEPVITAWKAAHPSVSGHQGRYEMREIVNALLYQSRTGCQWSMLPHDLPPRSAVVYYYTAWRRDGIDKTIHDLLRFQVREKAGRLADPSLVVLDTQSVRAAAGVPATTTGRDAAKKVPGRKRGLATDVLGLVIAVVVAAASMHDNAIGKVLLDRVAAATPPGSVQTALADQGFKSSVVAHGATRGIDVQIVERNPAGTGFVPPAQAVGGGADLRHDVPAPPPGTRLRTPPGQLRITGVLGDDRCDDPPADRHLRPYLARHVSRHPDPGTWLLERIDAREKALTGQAEQMRAQIDELAARLRDLDQDIEHLKITRKTLLALAEEPDPAPPAATDSRTPRPPRLPADPHHPGGHRTTHARSRPLPGPRPAPGAKERREHPSQAQTPGQPRHPHRDRARIVHSTTPVTPSSPHRPAISCSASDQRDINSRTAL
ncbi:hypothetical protein GCM10020001_035210 [Nonomuraea salmonea]